MCDENRYKKEDLHLRFLELESPVAETHSEDINRRYNEDNVPYFETPQSRPTDDSDLTSLFGTPESPSERQNSEEFLREFLSGNTFESNNLWDKSLNQREIRYGRKNIPPPSTESNLRPLSYSRRCSQCGTHYSAENTIALVVEQNFEINSFVFLK